MASKHITIPAGEYHLSAAIHTPEQLFEKEAPALIFIHGFVGNKIGEHRMFVKAARYFSSLGYICVRFDFSGCGESNGHYKDVTVTKKVDELKSVISYTMELEGVDPNRISLVGHSLGGAVTALTSPTIPQLNQVVLWAPVARPYDDIVSITTEDAVMSAKKNGVYDYQGFELSKSFFEDLKRHDPLTSISTFNGSVLIIHGDEDQEVPKSNADDYVTAAIDANRIFIDKGDHTFSSHAFENRLFNETAVWLSKRVKTTVNI
ncbi:MULTISPECIES: alpha/beta hydrolase family protein [Alkalihalophilus]|uniref:alpha/beta hydrolase family protein n=1 Tax=Alkalihalophilus TaxID=2893060 RepID=UPI00259BBD3F|nr:MULTISPECIES: alpha/beta hydrolase [Alkalihalophilus]MED1601385.1 alpha/beta hydrolase [Alkalihalophilus marmarensis]WEG18218.1 alpha/beta hydrolase [Alkalihalophilus pseudofirmus]